MHHSDPSRHPSLHLPTGYPPVLAVMVHGGENFAPARPAGDAHSSPAAIIAHEAARDGHSARCLRRLLFDGGCEIGAHLLPWATPPHDERPIPANSFAGNLPEGLEREKLARLTDRIEGAFGMRPRTFKAARGGIGPNTSRLLARFGYRVDVSVVPHHSYAAEGGPDFRRHQPFPRLLPRGIVQLPQSAGYCGPFAGLGPTLPDRLRLPGLIERASLSPERSSLADMVRLTRGLLQRNVRILVLSYAATAVLPLRPAAERLRFIETLSAYLAFARDDLGAVFHTPGEIAELLAHPPAEHRRLAIRQPELLPERVA